MSAKVSVLQNGISNVGSVCNALTHLGLPFEVIESADALKKASALIFPGVGAFGAAMRQLEINGLTDILKAKLVDEKIPYLGICLGLQLLFDSSEENPGVDGIGVLSGAVRRLPSAPPLHRVPNIGWCPLTIEEPSHPLWNQVEADSCVYFVHSYAAQPETSAYVAAVAQHRADFVAAVIHDNIHAVQFHPEKSGEVGLQILKNFVHLSHAI